MQDKRQFQRINSKLDIEITSCLSFEDIQDPGYVHLQSIDISKNGIMFHHISPLPISCLLEIACQLPYKKNPIMLSGRVVRVEELVPEKRYEIGIIFRDLDSSILSELNQHLESPN